MPSLLSLLNSGKSVRETESQEEIIVAEGGGLGKISFGLSDFQSPGLSFNSKIP